MRPAIVSAIVTGSLSKDIFQRGKSTGSGSFSFMGSGFAQIFGQIVSMRVKTLRKTNLVASSHIIKEEASLPVDVRRSKTSSLLTNNRPLPASKNPHFQNEAKCTTFVVKMSVICMRMKNLLHIKGWALNLVLIQRPEGTRNWLIGQFLFPVSNNSPRSLCGSFLGPVSSRF